MPLPPDQIELVRRLLGSDIWNDVIQPRLVERLKDKMRLLRLHPSERPDKAPDDSALRGSLEELEWMLTAWENEVRVADYNRQLAEREAAQENEAFAPANP